MNRTLPFALLCCIVGLLDGAEPAASPTAAASRASSLAAVPQGSKPLPKVLIIGDSISMAYTPVVHRELAGKADVSRPKTNCGETRMGLRGIDAWLGDTKWDVIHFNWGLWDLCYRNPKATTQGRRDKVNGTQAVPPEEYEANLEKLVVRMKQTGARLIWASTTLVPEEEAGRFVGDEVRYNAVAERVMKKHGVRIDDLHALSKAFDPPLFVKPGDVHYQSEANARFGKQVAESILAALSEK